MQDKVIMGFFYKHNYNAMHKRSSIKSS